MSPRLRAAVLLSLIAGVSAGCLAEGEPPTSLEPAPIAADLYRGSLPLCTGVDNGIVYDTRTWPCGSCVSGGAAGSEQALYARCRRSSQWRLIQVSCASCGVEDVEEAGQASLAGGPPCQECLDVLDGCTRDTNTPAESAACGAAFRECRVNRC